MENTKINKAKFFAQYWDQSVGCTQYQSNFKIGKSNFLNVEWLNLTPLSAISDEDAMTAIRIVKVYVRRDGAYITEHVPIENIKKSFLDVPIWRLDLADFLRSRGYLLPFHDLTPEMLIEYGWAKTK